MSTQIGVVVEIQDTNGKWNQCDTNGFMQDADSSVFGFLADVHNNSRIPPIAPLRGLPDDVSYSTKYACDYHMDCLRNGPSYLTAKELLDFDYDQEFEDRFHQIGTDTDDFGTVKSGEGEIVTYREFLYAWFFEDLEKLKAIGPPEKVRVVYWFYG